MIKKPYIISVKLEDVVMAESEKDARQQFRDSHVTELEGISDDNIECAAWEPAPSRTASSSASSIGGMQPPPKRRK